MICHSISTQPAMEVNLSDLDEINLANIIIEKKIIEKKIITQKKFLLSRVLL